MFLSPYNFQLVKNTEFKNTIFLKNGIYFRNRVFQKKLRINQYRGADI